VAQGNNLGYTYVYSFDYDIFTILNKGDIGLSRVNPQFFLNPFRKIYPSVDIIFLDVSDGHIHTSLLVTCSKRVMGD